MRSLKHIQRIRTAVIFYVQKKCEEVWWITNQSIGRKGKCDDVESGDADQQQMPIENVFRHMDSYF
jgi:hypothetical protein